MKLIIKILLELMQQAGQIKNMNGQQKKLFVMLKLKDGLELDPILEDFIFDVIDLLIDVDKNEIKINPKIKKLFICC